MSDQITAILLVGGCGTRIAEQHPGVPKPLVPVAGRPWLEWVVRHYVDHGVYRFVLATSHLGEQVEGWIEARTQINDESLVCVPDPTPRGTGGAVLNCLPHVCTPYVLIANGDTLLLKAPPPTVARIDGYAVGLHLADTGTPGRLRFNDSGFLTGLDDPSPGRQGWVNTGVYQFQTARLRVAIDRELDQPISFEALLNAALTRGRLRIVVAAHHPAPPFLDIGTPEGLARAEGFVREHLL